jgi:tetratricopeptide (TPR) repeat protein
MHWRPSYNKAVWEEIFRSAGACGVKGFEKIAIINPAQLAETPRTDALKRLSYAFFWMDEHELNEGALAELSYIREKDPELLGEGAVSPERLGKLLIHNFWSFGAELRIKSFFPLFLAHLAETERRFKNYPAALELCARALVLEPGNAYFRFERAQVLAGLGKKKEAESEFAALAPALFPKDGGNPRQAWGGVRLWGNLPEGVPPKCGASGWSGNHVFRTKRAGPASG